MSTDERNIEAAEAMVLLEQEDAIARIKGTLVGPGQDDCCDCGEPISAARRAAIPSAKRCIDCQSKFEMRGSRGI